MSKGNSLENYPHLLFRSLPALLSLSPVLVQKPNWCRDEAREAELMLTFGTLSSTISKKVR